jgi:hypothetical protein
MRARGERIGPVELGVWYLVAGLAVPALTWWGARILADRRGQHGRGQHGRGPAALITLDDTQSDLEELRHRVDELATQAARQESYLAGRIRALIAVTEDRAPLRFSLPVDGEVAGDGISSGGVTGDGVIGDEVIGGGVTGDRIPGDGVAGDDRNMAREPER